MSLQLQGLFALAGAFSAFSPVSCPFPGKKFEARISPHVIPPHDFDLTDPEAFIYSYGFGLLLSLRFAFSRWSGNDTLRNAHLHPSAVRAEARKRQAVLPTPRRAAELRSETSRPRPLFEYFRSLQAKGFRGYA